MRNGLSLDTLRISCGRSTSLASCNGQVRYKSVKKFLVPPSFHSHLKANHDRRKQQNGQIQIPPNQWRSNAASDKFQVPRDEMLQQNLDDDVERAVSNVASTEFGMSTEQILLQFCNRTHHPEITSFMKGYVSREPMDLQAAIRLWYALQDFLPGDPLNGNFITSPSGKVSHQSYTHVKRSTSISRLNTDVCANRMNMGWHLVLFNTPILGRSLLFDGTDQRFLPGPAAVWRYRLWAGGSINLHAMFAPPLDQNNIIHQVESPIDLRIVGTNQTPERLFVTVRKRFFQVEGTISRGRYTDSGVVEYLKQDPVHSATNNVKRGPSFEETYTLCFLRQPPDLAAKSAVTRVVAPPIQPKFSHTLTPNRHLLFCWSALTYNAHRIHLDQAFAEKEYGAKDLIVHGPLTLLLVLEWFHREITRYTLARQLSRFYLRSIDYKVLMPMYVDESMTLCTKPTKFQTPGTLADSWEVWVQKDAGDGAKTMTFKGTIKLRIEDEDITTQEDTASRSVQTDYLATS